MGETEARSVASSKVRQKLTGVRTLPWCWCISLKVSALIILFPTLALPQIWGPSAHLPQHNSN